MQYSLAAAVAGVSMLALAAPAAAEVVVTKKTINIPMASFQDFTTKISMANNGVNNFSFNLYAFSDFDRGLLMQGASTGDGILGSGFYQKAFALPRGSRIGPLPSGIPFNPYTALIEATETGNNSRYSRGNWGGNPENKYLGVSFHLKGKTHYGWIRVTVTTNLQVNGPFLSAKITGYAYETVPNKPILAGTAGIAAAAETPTPDVQTPENLRNQSGPSLGMLALGAGSLPMWRREETPVRSKTIPQRD